MQLDELLLPTLARPYSQFHIAAPQAMLSTMTPWQQWHHDTAHVTVSLHAGNEVSPVLGVFPVLKHSGYSSGVHPVAKWSVWPGWKVALDLHDMHDVIITFIVISLHACMLQIGVCIITSLSLNQERELHFLCISQNIHFWRAWFEVTTEDMYALITMQRHSSGNGGCYNIRPAALASYTAQDSLLYIIAS